MHANKETLQLAQYFIFLGNEVKREITNKKLQKLLYYAQAWSLVLRKKPIFEEQIEAWPHGPVIPEIYHHYKKFGFDFIVDKNMHESCESLPNEVKEHLDEVWRVYGKYDADYLEALSHSEDPWIKARSALDRQVSSRAIISHESMKEFYDVFLDTNRDQ